MAKGKPEVPLCRLTLPLQTLWEGPWRAAVIVERAKPESPQALPVKELLGHMCDCAWREGGAMREHRSLPWLVAHYLDVTPTEVCDGGIVVLQRVPPTLPYIYDTDLTSLHKTWDSGVRQSWVSILARPFTSCVTLEFLNNFYKLEAIHMSNEKMFLTPTICDIQKVTK